MSGLKNAVKLSIRDMLQLCITPQEKKLCRNIFITVLCPVTSMVCQRVTIKTHRLVSPMLNELHMGHYSTNYGEYILYILTLETQFD